jgi:hypothetical protein
MRKGVWVVLSLAVVVASAVFAATALGESGTVGDYSYTLVWTTGASGTKSTLFVKNTAGAGGTTITDLTLYISGTQLAAVSGGGCSTDGFCDTALDPGSSETISLSTKAALAPGADATVTFDDANASPQTVDIKLHGAKAKHKKSHHKKKRHKKKHHHT